MIRKSLTDFHLARRAMFSTAGVEFTGEGKTCQLRPAPVTGLQAVARRTTSAQLVPGPLDPPKSLRLREISRTQSFRRIPIFRDRHVRHDFCVVKAFFRNQAQFETRIRLVASKSASRYKGGNRLSNSLQQGQTS
jgi:hypothetical protein